MNLDDLHVGMRVRVIDFGDDEYERPEHWSEEGDMDEWQDVVVTIADIAHSEQYIYIEEDECVWQWYPWDFESYCELDYNDPNLRYKRHRNNMALEKMRDKLMAGRPKRSTT